MGKIVGELKKRRFMTYYHENSVLICPTHIITEDQQTEELVKFDEVLSIVDNKLI